MTTLFTDNFPTVRSDKELNVLKAQYSAYDEYYIASGSIPDRKQRFEELYKTYEPYADRHFLRQVKKNFHQRTWEMYLACVFIANGIQISSSNKGPDIKIFKNGQTIWIECIAPAQGTGPDRVPNVQTEGLHSVPEDEMVLRLSAALKEKFIKYQEYLSKGIVAPKDIFIIAVNRGNFDYPDTDLPLIFKCLFGLGHLTLSMDFSPEKGETVGSPYSHYSQRISLVKKQGGSVPMNFFGNTAHAGISAVIYSKEFVLRHPKRLGEDCILVHNPLATNSLSPDTFRFFTQHKVQGEELVKI
ncbi:MAG: hypothetical protein HYZ61_01975 [Candidatus Andersenbacteria bacterium]|nr:hypothetical protein [Candidatus Andersenbacteria bacterium]